MATYDQHIIAVPIFTKDIMMHLEAILFQLTLDRLGPEAVIFQSLMLVASKYWEVN
jgi:hypothetical protein